MNREELLSVQGGISWAALAGIGGGIITFILGLFEGLTNPVKCGK